MGAKASSCVRSAITAQPDLRHYDKAAYRAALALSPDSVDAILGIAALARRCVELGRRHSGRASVTGRTSPEMDPEAARSYSFVRCKLLYHLDGREVVIPPPAERFHLIEDTHHSLAHAGKEKLYDYLRTKFWWAGLYADVKSYCEGCLECSLQSTIFRRKD